MPILAEDLGVITPDVDSLREAIEAPGMLVLQFAWGGGSKNLYLPHNHYENSFVYPGMLGSVVVVTHVRNPMITGTHDNETTVGWWEDTATPLIKKHVMQYLNVGGKAEDVDIAWLFIQVRRGGQTLEPPADNNNNNRWRVGRWARRRCFRCRM